MIVVEVFRGKSVPEQRVEIVERKGVGHPDFICDAVMEAISIALSKEYLRRFGTVLHHNIDKGLLAAGRTIKRFGGGRVVKPMELIIGDRATFFVGRKEVPVKEIAIETAKRWFKRNLRFVDPERHLRYRVVLAEGSEELKDIFLRGGRTRGSNDTSAAVGYYPLSPTEEAVLQLEKFLNSKEFKKRYPETGEDIKIMGVRRENDLEITVAMPLLSRFINSEREYFERKEVIYEEMRSFLNKNFLQHFRIIKLFFNTLDTDARGLGGVYLSLLGTSAEDADSGQVGRGNRVNGLISINRPMGTEAAAGKNPVSHIGKIYNILSHRIAQQIYENVEGIKEVYVLLMNRIGVPVDAPVMANARVILQKGVSVGDIKREVEEIFEQEFSEINRLCMELAKGKHSVC